MRNRVLDRAVAVSVSFVAAGCGAMQGDPAALSPPAVVYFVNDALDQAAVYLISSSAMRTRIGTVMPGRTEALAIPDVIMGAGDVTVVARLLAGSRYISTGPFTLTEGDQYSIRLVSEVAPSLMILPASTHDIIAAERGRP